MEFLHSSFGAADTSGDGRIDEDELAADNFAAFVAVDETDECRLPIMGRSSLIGRIATICAGARKCLGLYKRRTSTV